MIADMANAMYLVHADGYEPKVWQELDSKQRRVHLRFLEACLKDRMLIDSVKALHLCPMPVNVPCNAFKHQVLQMALIDNEYDSLLFEELLKLYGVKKGFKEGLTTHLVLFATDKLERSKKLHAVRKWKQKPYVVS